jgi:hypothetical protein
LERLLESDDQLCSDVGTMLQYFDWLIPLFLTLRNQWPFWKGEDGFQENKLEVGRMV